MIDAAGRAAAMTVVVIGIGNDLRRDDGIGPAVAAAVATRSLPGVLVLACAAEPAAILDAWDGADVAVLIDAAVDVDLVPGRVRRWAVADLAVSDPLSSHDLDLRQTYELGLALDRVPQSAVVITVDAADTTHGSGLTPAVAAALPEAVERVLAVIKHAQEAAYQQP
jgi:hydrogenase maturation protease